MIKSINRNHQIRLNIPPNQIDPPIKTNQSDQSDQSTNRPTDLHRLAQVGDRIMATNGMLPIGGLAEYTTVHAKWAAKAPDNVSAVQAAALPNSPVAAMHAMQAAGIKEGERVLILGGSGGVGSSLLQLAKDAKVGCEGVARRCDIFYRFLLDLLYFDLTD